LKTLILFFASIIFISSNSFAQNENKILLNRTYKGKVIEDYNTTHPYKWKDEIIFKDNKIYFKVFSKNWGSPYDTCTISVDSNTKIITFISEEVRNDENESRKLSGTINGDVINGTVVITRNDWVKRPYSFSGKIK
jgi:hypothetical protein